jgi:diguanylate cyclase
MSSQLSNPPDIARETLKTLALRKIPPTPSNYGKIYAEISGIAPEDNHELQQVLQSIADLLAKQTGKNAVVGKQLMKSLESNDWESYLAEIGKVLAIAKDDGTLIPSWSELIRDLLRQLETPHKGLTLTRKKEGVETVLSRFAANSETLFEKLNGLVRSWTVTPSTVVSTADLLPDVAADTTAQSEAPSATALLSSDLTGGEMNLQLRDLLTQTLERTLSTEPEFSVEVGSIAEQIRCATNCDQITKLAKQLRNFWLKIELRGGDKAKIQEGLVRLLRLLVENVGELVEDEGWLHGQIATLQEIVAYPINRFVIADAERSLRDAIIKQSLLKRSLNDAKTTLKMLMTSFVDRLGELSESTGDYHQKLEDYNQRIGNTNNITELSHLLEDIMQDTRVIQASAIRSHEELLSTRKQVQEATRADRSESSLCVALLDIDNFKHLNDTFGHRAGDQALIHLSSVIKEALRPSDSVARYGGEEFVILLPDVSIDDAQLTISRLQRELTKKFFLHENDRVLITFSAGVALRAPQEDQEDVVGRADKAMYQAKRAGRNQVIAAE